MRYDFSPTNQLIKNLKIKPSAIERSPARGRYKEQAILHAANAIRRLMSRELVETRATFVPVPCSKAVGHTDYDDRLARVLHLAFRNLNADVREMLTITQSTSADHESDDRLTFDELLAVTTLSNPAGTAPRAIVIVVDDVLNSGKHFKVAQSLVTARYQDVKVRGLFLARCIREPAE
jgi:predicted amidophosphoribosyltransferase